MRFRNLHVIILKLLCSINDIIDIIFIIVLGLGFGIFKIVLFYQK